MHLRFRPHGVRVKYQLSQSAGGSGFELIGARTLEGMHVAAWSSLADQRRAAENLFGDQGARLFANWLDEQLDRVDNLDFARQFSDHIDLPGVQPADYAHRIVRSGTDQLLGGIRFYRRNLDRPFVDVIASTYDDLDALCDCVRAEWAVFAPSDLRLRTRPGLLNSSEVRLDVTIHAARYANMARPDGRVRLQPFTDPDDAIVLVQSRFEHMRNSDPQLHANVTAADPKDLREWHAAGQLRAIVAEGAVVGALAIVPGGVDWIGGDEVHEEIIDTDFSGHGYAAAAQAAWAHTVATDPSTYLVGTIDHLNIASRRSAERAGRPRILDDVFVALTS